MIDHISVGTNDLARARAFYDAVLVELGIRLLGSSGSSADYGVSGILFSVETPVDGNRASSGNGTHIAFAAGSREIVDRFHRAALANGGTDGGAPGLRPNYDAHYYGAFAFDPDGNKIEAVTRSSK